MMSYAILGLLLINDFTDMLVPNGIVDDNSTGDGGVMLCSDSQLNNSGLIEHSNSGGQSWKEGSTPKHR